MLGSGVQEVDPLYVSIGPLSPLGPLLPLQVTPEHRAEVPVPSRSSHQLSALHKVTLGITLIWPAEPLVTYLRASRQGHLMVGAQPGFLGGIKAPPLAPLWPLATNLTSLCL